MSFFNSDQMAAMIGATVRIDLLAEFQFVSRTERVWNGYQDLQAGGQTWRAMYGAGRMDGIAVSGGGVSEACTFTVPGLPDAAADILASALAETNEVTQELAIVYVQLFDADWQPIGSPIGIFWGFMQPPRVTRTPMSEAEGGGQAITVVAENAFFNRSKPPHGRYTDRDQQSRAPGDLFFEFTPTLLFKTFVWPDF